MFRSCSSLYWFWKEPAAARVVAREENIMDGAGFRDVSVEVQVEVSGLVWELVGTGEEGEAGGSRRVMVAMLFRFGEAVRRTLRMWVPYNS